MCRVGARAVIRGGTDGRCPGHPGRPSADRARPSADRAGAGATTADGRASTPLIDGRYEPTRIERLLVFN